MYIFNNITYIWILFKCLYELRQILTISKLKSSFVYFFHYFSQNLILALYRHYTFIPLTYITDCCVEISVTRQCEVDACKQNSTKLLIGVDFQIFLRNSETEICTRCQEEKILKQTKICFKKLFGSTSVGFMLNKWRA